MKYCEAESAIRPKTIYHEGADIELDALTNRKPGEGVSDERNSGVTRGAGARGQGILVAPPEKSEKIFCSSAKTLMLILQNFL